MQKVKSHNVRNILLVLLLLVVLFDGAYYLYRNMEWNEPEQPSKRQTVVSLESIPDYSGEPYVVINGNSPFFGEGDITTSAFETYSPLDSLGRCGAAYANICIELMPTEARGAIGSVRPSGWQTTRYDGLVDGNYLYNRCHLIGFQLAGENANDRNLVTGTRYMNVQGMLPFENMVADYVKETENHVLYRVTPMFEGDHLVCDGVLMEAWSVEDDGDGVAFCVYAYNVQPGVRINYATGESVLDDTITGEQTYILNTGSKKFHLPECDGVATIKDTNRTESNAAREILIAQGYAPCGKCRP